MYNIKNIREMNKMYNIRLMSFVVALSSTVFFCFSVNAEENFFTDVPDDHWAR